MSPRCLSFQLKQIEVGICPTSGEMCFSRSGNYGIGYTTKPKAFFLFLVPVTTSAADCNKNLPDFATTGESFISSEPEN